MSKASKFLGGASIGVLVGAAVALLLAPNAPTSPRGSLAQRLKAIREEAQRAAAEQRAALEAELARLRDETG